MENKGFGPAMTLAYEKLEGGKLLLTIARCSEKDRWSHKKALMICRGRFAKGKKLSIVPVNEGADIYQVLNQEARKYEESVQQSRRSHS